MEDWILKVIPDTPWPIAILLGMLWLAARMISALVSLLKPRVEKDISAGLAGVNRIEMRLDDIHNHIEKIQQDITKIHGRVSHLEGESAARVSGRRQGD